MKVTAEGHCQGVMVGEGGCLWSRVAGSWCLPGPQVPCLWQVQEVEPQLPPCAAPLLPAPRGPLLSQGGQGRCIFQKGGQRGSTAVWPPVSVKEICLVPQPWNGSRNHGFPGEVGAGQISVPNPPPLQCGRSS